MTKKRFPNTLAAMIAREVASTGQQKRWCSSCGNHVFDQDRTDSKYCQECRRRVRITEIPDV